MSILRNTAGTVLGGAAQALSLTSKLLEATAKTLRPDVGGGGGAAVQRADGGVAVQPPPATATATAEPPAETPLLDETPHVRTSESHVAELASKPASEVIAAVSGLGTDELRALTEHELAHKNRRTVLAAIERALTPSPGATSGGQRDREIVLPEAGGVPTSGTLDGAS